MEFVNVIAIIRNEMVESVERALQKTGVLGFTVTKVTGVGEWEKRFSLFAGPSTHVKLEIFAEANRAEQIASVLMETAHTGTVGDGLVAVSPLHKVVRIRPKDLARAGEE